MHLVQAQLQPLPCSDRAAFHYVHSRDALPGHVTHISVSVQCSATRQLQPF